MSAEPIIESATSAAPKMRFVMRPVHGFLADGTPFYAPIGAVLTSDARVACHLCGRWFRSVAAHLRVHGWTKGRYCQAFGLERSQSLEGPETRKLRSAALAARLVFEPAVREGSAAGRARAKSGQLAKDAATAARGRPFPEQRRKKNARARAARQSAAASAAGRERADQHLTAVATAAAAQHGYADIGALVSARTLDGASLASISREIGLHKDWLSRHLGRLDPVAAGLASEQRSKRADQAWIPALTGLGYSNIAAYLRDRHLTGHQTVNMIATEIGVSHHSV